MPLPPEIFDAQRQPRHGTANPERFRLEFWDEMVRNAEELRRIEESEEPDEGRAGLMVTPYDARTHYEAEIFDGLGPIWTFSRLGMTRTTLDDGRVICVGGEHEDFYDPDFYIYNDVIVLQPDGSIEIYGYPREVLPPIDNHTATLDGGRLILIGGIGYQGERSPGETPVFALDLATYRVERLPSEGSAPGWISRHDAELADDGTIVVRNGEVYEEPDDADPRMRKNLEEFAYDPATGTWTQRTARNWRQYTLRDSENGLFMHGPRPDYMPTTHDLGLGFEIPDVMLYLEDAALLPRDIPYELVASEPYHPEIHLRIAGIDARILFNTATLTLIIEGPLDPTLADRLARSLQSSIETITGRPCTLESPGGTP